MENDIKRIKQILSDAGIGDVNSIFSNLDSIINQANSDQCKVPTQNSTDSNVELEVTNCDINNQDEMQELINQMLGEDIQKLNSGNTEFLYPNANNDVFSKFLQDYQKGYKNGYDDGINDNEFQDSLPTGDGSNAGGYQKGYQTGFSDGKNNKKYDDSLDNSTVKNRIIESDSCASEISKLSEQLVEVNEKLFDIETYLEERLDDYIEYNLTQSLIYNRGILWRISKVLDGKDQPKIYNDIPEDFEIINNAITNVKNKKKVYRKDWSKIEDFIYNTNQRMDKQEIINGEFVKTGKVKSEIIINERLNRINNNFNNILKNKPVYTRDNKKYSDFRQKKDDRINNSRRESLLNAMYSEHLRGVNKGVEIINDFAENTYKNSSLTSTYNNILNDVQNIAGKIANEKFSTDQKVWEFIGEYENRFFQYSELKQDQIDIIQKLKNFSCGDQEESFENESDGTNDGSAPLKLSEGGKTPTVTTLKYWQKWANVATLVNLPLLPLSWPIGIVIPTPGGLIKIPMPVIWFALACIPTPIGIFVIFLGLCGICPSPFILWVDAQNRSMRFIVSLRGPQTIRSSGELKSTTAVSIDIADLPDFKVNTENPTSYSNVIDNVDLQLLSKLIQDDLPDWSRLNITNIAWVLKMLVDWGKAGKKGGGFFEQ